MLGAVCILNDFSQSDQSKPNTPLLSNWRVCILYADGTSTEIL